MDCDFLAPQLGDVIVTVEPLKCDSLTHRAGDHLRVKLTTPEAVEEARKLVALRRWTVERKGGE